MPVTTVSAALHITPVVVKTFFEHGKQKAKRLKESKKRKEIPQDDIFFDQAFNIVKAFIAMGTKNTIESLQAFTNTHVPAPYWAAVSPVVIPLSTCNDAADYLIKWFGPDELKYIVGGERWWQVRGLSGIDGEWIAELDHLDPEILAHKEGDKKLSTSDANILRMEKLESVMLYVHGGGYSWGSINTHRYQIIHYVRKFEGRAFAVNYRKAPQYPWPCPLQDVIAAYLYLIRPPPGALHKAIPSSKIVFAGDSAGGGLCISVLAVLRDLGLSMPAGAVLISPWVDLTHSFPSIMENYDTDIIPKYGFIAKPSTLWPIPTQPENGGRIVSTVTNEPPNVGHPDTLKPRLRRLDKTNQSTEVYGPGESIKTQGEMLEHAQASRLDSFMQEAPHNVESSKSSSKISSTKPDKNQEALDEKNLKNWRPKPPKVLMEDPNRVPLELRSQIQMYATTEQLTHPLVSPILQASLGNLPPLYIIGGDGEVLRDEIIYLAHKAAHPSKYQTRPEVLHDSPRQKENFEKFTIPTKVHLQIFDGMCHVLTVFMFTESSKYAYQSIAEFIKHVTVNDAAHLDKNPFPELHRPPSKTPSHLDFELQKPNTIPCSLKKEAKAAKAVEGEKYRRLHQDEEVLSSAADHHSGPPSDIELYTENEEMVVKEHEQEKIEMLSGTAASSSNRPTSTVASHHNEDIAAPLMIRERVDLYANVRPMERIEDIKALNLDISQIGIIKEAPVIRWQKGQDLWDKRYAKNTRRVLKQKAKYEAKAARILVNAVDKGFVHRSHGLSKKDDDLLVNPETVKTAIGKIEPDRRWGPLDLDDERPPPSAIAGRRDTPDAIALLRKSIYNTAPVTHLTVPTRKMADAVRAAFDPNDDPNKPPQQSASEQQVRTHIIPFHGLRMWDSIVRYLGRKSSAKAARGINATVEKIGLGTQDEVQRI